MALASLSIYHNNQSQTSFHSGDPAISILFTALLDIQQVLSDLIGDSADVQLRIHGYWVILAIVVDIADSADDHSRARPEAFQQFSLLLPLDYLADEDLAL